jgi:hypothetical protein
VLIEIKKQSGACANEIIPSINRSFVYKAKEAGYVRIKYSPNLKCYRNTNKKYMFCNGIADISQFYPPIHVKT